MLVSADMNIMEKTANYDAFIIERRLSGFNIERDSSAIDSRCNAEKNLSLEEAQSIESSKAVDGTQNSSTRSSVLKDLDLEIFKAQLSNNPSQKESQLGNWILGPVLGEGEFGKVRIGWPNQVRGKSSEHDSQVAIKLIRKQSLNGERQKFLKIQREIKILSKCSHPNIVKLIDVIDSERHIGIVLACASGGELFDFILQNKYLKDAIASRLFAQLVSGVRYLHQHGIVHRDLKLENLLLDSERNIIITDFGFATQFNVNNESNFGSIKPDLMDTSCGSPCYAAPELVMSDGKYEGRKVDVWSCGVILYAMLAGYLPFDDDPNNPDSSNINLLYKYITSTPLTFPNYVSPLARSLLHLILIANPDKRASLRTIANHAFLEPYWNLFKSKAYSQYSIRSEKSVNLGLVTSKLKLSHRPLPASDKRHSVQYNQKASNYNYMQSGDRNFSLPQANSKPNVQQSEDQRNDSINKKNYLISGSKRAGVRDRLPLPSEKPRPTSYHPTYGMPSLSTCLDTNIHHQNKSHSRHDSLIHPVSTTTKSTFANAPGELHTGLPDQQIGIPTASETNHNSRRDRVQSMYVNHNQNYHDDYKRHSLANYIDIQQVKLSEANGKSKQKGTKPIFQGLYNIFNFRNRSKNNKEKLIVNSQSETSNLSKVGADVTRVPSHKPQNRMLYFFMGKQNKTQNATK